MLVSVDCAGNAGNGSSPYNSEGPRISDDGTLVVFVSSATNLITGDTNNVTDAFVCDFSVPPFDAFWANYGTGFAGTLGVPTLTSSADPAFGTTISVDAGNSYGSWSVGLLVLGLNSASIPTSAGGTLLVDPLLFVVFGLPPSGASFTGDIPRDPALCGVSIYLQALELDPGAQHGISFTPGLQLAIGH